MLRSLSKKAILILLITLLFTMGAYSEEADFFAPDAYDSFVNRINSFGSEQNDLFKYLDSLEVQLAEIEPINIDNRLIWHFKYIRAVNYGRLGYFDESLEYFEKAFENAWINKNDLFQMHTELSAGNVYYRLGYYRMAKRKYEFALQKAEMLQDKNIEYKTNHNLGIIAKYEGEYEKSQQFFDKALQIRADQGNERELGYLYNNLGTLNNETHKPDQALKYYYMAEEFFLDGSNNSMLGKIYNNIGNVYMETGEIAKAQKFFSKSLEYKSEGTSGYITTLTNLGILNLGLDNERAFALLDSTEKYSKENEFFTNLEMLYNNYIDYYETKGDYNNALKYLEKRLEVRDSLYNIEKELQLTDIRKFYDLENKSNKLEALKYENAIKTNKIKINKLYMLIGMIIFVLATFSIIFLIIQQKKKREEISLLIDKKEELEEKRKRKRVVLEMYQKMQKQLEERIQVEIEHIRSKDSMIMIQSRHSTMGEMIGNIAHQWRQPINAIGIIIQDFADAFEYGELDDEYFEKKTAIIDQLIEYMEHTIDDFKNFFQPEKSKKNFSAGDVLKRAVEFVSCTFQARNIEYDTKIISDIELFGISNEFFQVILNIMNNAKDAFKLNNTPVPRMNIEMGKLNPKTGYITIQDNAGGIDEDVLDKLFEPYITTKEEVKGTGMGLYIAKHIIKVNFQGEIKAANKEEGACFTIKIPLADTKLS